MTIRAIEQRIRAFVTERDWQQFHKPKDVAISLSLESAEVLEHFQWKTAEETASLSKKDKEAIGGELADVLYWVVLLSHYMEVDLEKAFQKKMNENEKKYPVTKARGKATKYTKL